MAWRTSPASWALPSLDTAAGCFETMRAYRGMIFRLDEHLERLYGSAHYMGLAIADSRAELARRLNRELDASGFREAVVRVVLIPDTVHDRPLAVGGRMREAAARPSAPSIVVKPAEPLRDAVYRKGITIAVVPTRKFPISQIDPQSKYSSRLASVMAVAEAQLRGADEAIFMDAHGLLAESTASNLGMVKRGALIAPPTYLGLLAGVTWHAAMEAAARVKIPVREEPITRHDIYNADEVFMTSTLKDVLGVRMVDGREIGDGRPGPVTHKLLRAFRALVEEEISRKRRP